MKDNDKSFEYDDLLLDDILAEFCPDKEEKSKEKSDIPEDFDISEKGDKISSYIEDFIVQNKKESITENSTQSTEPDHGTAVSEPKKEFKLNRELVDEKVKDYLGESPENSIKGLTTKETLNKNKLDAFFETFYSQESKSKKEDFSPSLTESNPSIEEQKEAGNPALEETPFSVVPEETLNTYEDEEDETESVFPEPALPERFYVKDDFKTEFPIKAPPSTDTKINENTDDEDSGEFYETTGEITGKKSVFARLMSKLLTEAEDDEEPVETETPPLIEIDEFESPEDKDSVLSDLCLQKKEAFFKTAISGAVTLLLLYLNAGSVSQAILPSFLRPSGSAFAFGTASVLLLLIMAITGFGTFLSGVRGILTFKGTNDTLPAFALISSLVFSVYFALAGIPDGSYLCFFGGAAGLSFFFNLLGKYLHITTVGNNIGFLVNEKEKSTLSRMAKSELPSEIDTENNEIAGVVKGNFFTGFFEKSFSDDPSAKYSKRTSWLVIVFTIALSVFAFFKGGLFFALTALCGMSTLGASFLSGTSFSLPNIRWLSKLKKSGAMIAGYSSAALHAEVNALVIPDTELFPPKTTEVTGMKMFGGSEIYDVAISMASLYAALGGPLESAFLKMIDRKKELLKTVTELKLFEGRGVGGFLDGKEIFAGNSALMREKDVRLPYDDYEERLLKKGKHVIFFAEERVLKGLFTIEYSPNTERIRDLTYFDYENNALLIYSDDQNISADLIRKKFGLSHMEVLVYGNETGAKMKPALEKKERLPAGIISLTGISGIIHAIYAAKRLKKSVRVCLAMRAVSTLLAFGLGGFLIYSGTVMEPMQVLGYQSIWGVLAFIITMLGL